MDFNGKIKVGIIGAAGYTAGELLRILVNHPAVEVAFAQSSSHAGEPLWSAHADLLGETDLCFSTSPELVEGPDVLFLCSGHGKAKPFVEALPESYKGTFTSASDSERQSLAFDLKEQLSYLEPRIDDIDVMCRDNDALEGSIIVEVSYRVRSTNNRYNHVYPFFMTEGSEGGETI